MKVQEIKIKSVAGLQTVSLPGRYIAVRNQAYSIYVDCLVDDANPQPSTCDFTVLLPGQDVNLTPEQLGGYCATIPAVVSGRIYPTVFVFSTCVL